MSVDVSMAIQMRGSESGIDHAIDLRLAFEIYVGRIKKSERSPTEQSRQRIELLGTLACQRRCAGKRPPDREIEVKTQREIGA